MIFWMRSFDFGPGGDYGLDPGILRVLLLLKIFYFASTISIRTKLILLLSGFCWGGEGVNEWVSE